MTSISLSLLATYAAYARARFVRKTQQVIATQDQFLCNLLQLHRETELGQQFGLREIKTIDQFRSRIPILPYDSYETYVNRIAAGEKNVLNPWKNSQALPDEPSYNTTRIMPQQIRKSWLSGM